MTKNIHLDDLGKVHLASECYVVKDDKILMFKRSDTSSKFPGWWIGPGGHIDEGEDAQTAVIREIEEEAGIIVTMNNIKLKAVAFHHHMDLNEVWISFVYLASVPEIQTEGIESTEGKAKWIPRNELMRMENIFPPSKFDFDHVLGEKPGIMYTNIQWNKAQLVKVRSKRIDVNG